MEPKTTNKGITLLEENLWNCTAEKQISGFLGVFIQSFSGLLLLCRFKAHRQLWSFSAQEV